jgi:hypothetical protein
MLSSLKSRILVWVTPSSITNTTTSTTTARYLFVNSNKNPSSYLKNNGRNMIPRRRLATDSNNPPTPSTSNTGLALMAVAIALPVGAIFYLEKTNPSWRKSLPVFLGGEATPLANNNNKSSSENKSKILQKSPTTLTTKTTTKTTTTTQPSPNTEKPVQVEEDWAAIKKEVEELAQKLEQADEEATTTTTMVRFSQQEVNQVREKVQQAQEKADADAITALASEAVSVTNAVQPENNNTTDHAHSSSSSSSEQNKLSSSSESHSSSSSSNQQESPERQSIEAVRNTAEQITKRATDEARQHVVEADAQLRNDLERVLAHDLSTLNEAGLRERLVQLVLELKDRNRWEAARLHEIITKTTEELAKKYTTLMREQEVAYEAVVRAESAKAALEATHATEAKLSTAMQEHIDHQREIFREEMLELVEKVRQQEREEREREREIRLKSLEEIQNKIKTLEMAFKEEEMAKLASQRNQRVAATALRFVSSVLLKKAPGANSDVEKYASELRIVSGGDEIIVTALNTLPARVFAGGIDSFDSLTNEFNNKVQVECLEKALTEQHPGLLQNAVARATTALNLVKPDLQSGVEIKLDRIKELLSNRDMAGAVAVMETLPTEIKRVPTAKIWLARAKDRVAVELCLRTIVAHVSGK